MKKKLKIVLHFRHFPVAMGRFFHWALKDLGHQIFTVGSYLPGGKIPWGEQFAFPKYDWPPNLELPAQERYPISEVLKKVPFKPDLIIQAADVEWLEGKAPCPNVIIATDPHCIDYHPRLENADYFFCMQKCYMAGYDFPKSFWLPYAYLPTIHKFMDLGPPLWDVVFIGLQYPQRVETLQRITDKGWLVFNSLGYIYKDYVDTYSRGQIAFNWSSQNDLPARFWEGLAMKRVVLTNRVPDLAEFDFEEGVDYLAFSDQDEAVAKADYYLRQPELLLKIAENGYKKVKKHTYQARCKEMLKKIYG